jgi:hypothetical protein
MAVLDQFDPCINALTRVVTYDCPTAAAVGGCSLACQSGVTQDTDGSVPAAAAVTKFDTGWILPV